MIGVSQKTKPGGTVIFDAISQPSAFNWLLAES
jgi:hypothetical protein